MLNYYRLKISLIESHAVPISQLHRIIEISGNATFANLHELIFEAFDRREPCLYKFMLTRREATNRRILYQCNEEVICNHKNMISSLPEEERPVQHNAETFTLDEAAFQEKDFFYYWFDFIDDWIHRIKIEKILQDKSPAAENPETWRGVILKKVGESPAQY